MTNKEAVNWLINLTADIGKSEHRDLWHYEQALYEIRDMLQSLDGKEANVPSIDTISRQGAIDAVKRNTFRLTFAEEQNCEGHVAWSAEVVYSDVMEGALLELQPAQPSLVKESGDLVNDLVKDDTISRKQAIDRLETIGYDFSDSGLSEIELEEVCEAVGDVRQDMIRMIKQLPSVQPERIQNNAVHLCDSCQYTYVTCPSHGNDAVFGDGKGNDNICACNKYRPISAQPERVWTPCDIPPEHHRDVIVRGIEAIGNVTVHNIMQWDVDRWRPENYAPSIIWLEWCEI